MATSKKAVATAEKAGLPAEIDFTQDAGLGLDNIGKDDILIPRFAILQAQSKAVDEDSHLYVEGAKAGLILNSAFDTLEDALHVVPVARIRHFVEWQAGHGAFVEDHGENPTILDECTEGEGYAMLTPEGNEIFETVTFYVLVVKEDGVDQAVLSMSKKQLKKAKKWTGLISKERVPRPDGNGTYQPPIFYRSYKLTTVKEKNDSGSWYGWKIDKDVTLSELPNAREIYQMAKSFHSAVAKGEVKAAQEGSAEPTEGDGF